MGRGYWAKPVLLPANWQARRCSADTGNAERSKILDKIKQHNRFLQIANRHLANRIRKLRKILTDYLSILWHQLDRPGTSRPSYKKMDTSRRRSCAV